MEATLNNAAFAGNSSVFLTGGVLLSAASVVDTLEALSSYAPGAIAVSYTHLDVYKRQTFLRLSL